MSCDQRVYLNLSTFKNICVCLSSVSNNCCNPFIWWWIDQKNIALYRLIPHVQYIKEEKNEAKNSSWSWRWNSCLTTQFLGRKLLSLSQCQELGQRANLAPDCFLFPGSQSEAKLAIWPNSWHWLQHISFHPCSHNTPL